MDIEALAIEMAKKHFSYGGFRHGQEILSKVMNRWAKRYSRGWYSSNRTFEARYYRRQEPNLKNPPIRDIYHFVVYPGESRYRHILRGLSMEWIYRSVVYYHQLPKLELHKERDQGIKGARKFWELLIIPNPVPEILRLFSNLSLDDGLDFFSMLTVHWSMRFSSRGFIKWIRSLGWIQPGHIDINDYTCQCAIMFLAMDFQLEYIVPIYWEIINERESREKSQAT